MDSKRYFVLILVGFLLILPLLNTGCKKGEDDPFFSIYTRNSRLTGEWTVSSYWSEIKYFSTESDTATLTTTEINNTEDWEQLKRIIDSDWEKQLRGEVFRYRINFAKTGRMTSYYNYQYVDEEGDEDADEITIKTVNVKEEITGTWNFLGGADDYKYKERLAIIIEDIKTVTTTSTLKLTDIDDEDAIPDIDFKQEVQQYKFANGEMSTIYSIRMLKKKEMILEQDINAFEIIRNPDYSSSVESHEGSMTMTLVKE